MTAQQKEKFTCNVNQCVHFRKMQLDGENFDFKYVSDGIMSNLSLAEDYPSIFTMQGTFSRL